MAFNYIFEKRSYKNTKLQNEIKWNIYSAICVLSLFTITTPFLLNITFFFFDFHVLSLILYLCGSYYLWSIRLCINLIRCYKYSVKHRHFSIRHLSSYMTTIERSQISAYDIWVWTNWAHITFSTIELSGNVFTLLILYNNDNNNLNFLNDICRHRKMNIFSSNKKI